MPNEMFPWLVGLGLIRAIYVGFLGGIAGVLAFFHSPTGDRPAHSRRRRRTTVPLTGHGASLTTPARHPPSVCSRRLNDTAQGARHPPRKAPGMGHAPGPQLTYTLTIKARRSASETTLAIDSSQKPIPDKRPNSGVHVCRDARPLAPPGRIPLSAAKGLCRRPLIMARGRGNGFVSGVSLDQSWSRGR
jgi:hypothetical protein